MRKILFIGIATMFFLTSFSQNSQRFELVGEKTQAEIQLSDKEVECVRIAAMDLVSDVRKITGKTLAITSKKSNKNKMVIIQTIYDLSKWESYTIESNQGNLYIRGSDERGTMFGIYHFLEEYLGVDPMYYWSGCEPLKQSTLNWLNCI
jgi:hypothetical protein